MATDPFAIMVSSGSVMATKVWKSTDNINSVARMPRT